MFAALDRGRPETWPRTRAEESGYGGVSASQFHSEGERAREGECANENNRATIWPCAIKQMSIAKARNECSSKDEGERQSRGTDTIYTSLKISSFSCVVSVKSYSVSLPNISHLLA